MKSVVVYGSRSGNTRRVAEAIAAALEEFGPSRILAAEDASATVWDHCDLLIVGGPTEGRHATPPVRAFFDRHLRDACATLLGYLWSDYNTSRNPVACTLRRLNMGKRLTPMMRRAGEVEYAFFENGLVAVNGAARRRAVSIPPPRKAPYSALRNLADGKRIAPARDGYRVTLPAHGGRVLVAN